jgi:uncharacterized protein (DUF1501 family)
LRSPPPSLSRNVGVGEAKPLGAAGAFVFNPGAHQPGDQTPSMPNFARLYRAGQAAVAHASATPCRDRSHFDGQDVLLIRI